jgi:hypothetical protein
LLKRNLDWMKRGILTGKHESRKYRKKAGRGAPVEGSSCEGQ